MAALFIIAAILIASGLVGYLYNRPPRAPETIVDEFHEQMGHWLEGMEIATEGRARVMLSHPRPEGKFRPARLWARAHLRQVFELRCSLPGVTSQIVHHELKPAREIPVDFPQRLHLALLEHEVDLPVDATRAILPGTITASHKPGYMARRGITAPETVTTHLLRVEIRFDISSAPAASKAAIWQRQTDWEPYVP